jgi:hypothetical protein
MLRLKVCLTALIFGLFVTTCNRSSETELVVSRVDENYSHSFRNYSDWFALPVYYLQALAAVEVSGRKEIPHRFESHVYEKLVRVKNGKIDRFENILPEDLKDVPDSSLQAMAKSWGPFQLMGYKCFYLHITVEELMDSSAFYGAQWIDLSYGDLVRSGDFINAFHVHNTGKKLPSDSIPLTFDPKYIEKGMNYLRLFRQKGLKRKEKIRIKLR